MDTDDLTPMAYEIIVKASRILDVLKSEIGASAMHKKNEDDFLRGVRSHLRAILHSTTGYLEYWNYLDMVERGTFRSEVKKLLGYVEATLETPHDQRGEVEDR